jgi:hypothetical protein
MEHHAQRRTMLQVEFEGESGIGSGVHVSFFTDAAARLEEWAENLAVGGMWMADTETPRGTALMCDLYPRTLLSADAGTVEAVCRRFRLVGWLVGKVLMDKELDHRMLPLRLSPVFLDLVLGREHQTYLQLRDVDTAAGEEHLMMLASLSRSGIQGGAQVVLLLEQITGVRAGTIELETAQEMIEVCDMCFTDPASIDGGVPLCDGGAEKRVAWENVEEFLSCLSTSWFGEGVMLQVKAFRGALFQVVPPAKLQIFSTGELLRMICGEPVVWDRAALEASVIPGEGYTQDAPAFVWLLEYLEAADGGTRRAFLKFVAARVRLPSGGLRALPRKITVNRQGRVESLPHGHTCSLSLDLPPYGSPAELRDRLEQAFALMLEYEGLVD